MLLVKEKVYSSVKREKSNEVIRTDVFHMNEEKEIKLNILSSNSPRNQGVVFIADNGISIKNEPKQRTVILWKEDLQSELILKCSSGFLNIFNVWEEERTIGFHELLSGMRIQKEKDVFIYSCNDAYGTGDFTSIIFSIEILD